MGGETTQAPSVPTETSTDESSLRLKLTRVATALDAPDDLASTPGEPNRLYVVEQPGRIRVIENGRLSPQPFLDITSAVQSGGERGLLSVAFHPDYANNGLFYVDYTDLDGDTRVVEFEARGGEAPAREPRAEPGRATRQAPLPRCRPKGLRLADRRLWAT